jgi:dUTP pyrophosphatase
MKLRVKKINNNATTPIKAYNEDAGMDIHSVEDAIIRPGETIKVKTGIALAMPPQWDTSHEIHAALIWDRSSLGSKGVHRLAGVVDYGYRNEILICLTNLNIYPVLQYLLSQKENEGDADIINACTYSIKKGDKIAQILFQKISKCPPIEIVDELDDTDRNKQGFGSSGQ